MRSCRVSGALSAVIIAACATLTVGPSAATAAEPPHHTKLPALKPLNAPKQSLRKARVELLASLYDQLKAAESEAGSELIVAAIEKVWSQSGSDTANVLMERAGLAIKARNYELATSLLQALTEVEPRYAEGWNQLATIYFLREDYENAMHQLKRVLALEPHHFKAIEGLSIILRETGRKKAALKATRQVLAIYPHLKTAKQAEEELTREVEGQGI
jgi:tetratricopeptide (TPR) repeat protein